MRPRGIRSIIERECEFPIAHRELVERIDEVRIDAQTGDAVRIAAVLDRTPEEEYRTASDAYHAVLGNVGDAYVGRKRYDDRAGAVRRREQVSF